jgi:hypothetical protein
MKKLIILLSAITLLVGCSPSYTPSTSYVLMSVDDVRKFITVTNNVTPIGDMAITTDTYYAVPTLDWINKHYTPQLSSFLFKNQLRTPAEVENDCDDYALYAAAVGHLMHRHASNKPKGTSLTIGEFAYLKELSGHVINFFIATDNSGKLVLVFYEPQLQKVVELDPKSEAVFFWKM